MSVVLAPSVPDSTALQAVLDRGESLALGPGIFALTAPLVIRRPGQAIVGAGMDSTMLMLQGGTNAVQITPEVDGPDRVWGARVSSLTILDGGVLIDRGYFCELEHLRILDTPVAAVRVIGTSGVYAAYNKLRNVSASGGTGHGIICDIYSEFTELYGCNASYYQGGDPAANYYDEPPTTAGIGLLLRGGNNVVQGGHFDRCRVPIYLEFSHGSRISTATDNALDCAVALKGSHSNRLELGVGRCDPKLPDGSPNPRYGTRRAINVVNVSAGNVFSPTFHADNNPPAGAWPLGGWRYHLGGSSGEGLAANGGPNLVMCAQPAGIAIRFDGGSSGANR